MTKPYKDLEESLKRLKKRWPKPLPKEVIRLFSKAQSSLRGIKGLVNGKVGLSARRNYFNFVAILNQTLKLLDMTFLSRQITYHVVAASDLPKAFGSAEEAQAVLEQLIKSTAKQVGFASRLGIRLKGVRLSGGPALQTELLYTGKIVDDEQRRRILHAVFSESALLQKERRGFGYAKMLIRRVGGQLWMEFPESGQIAFTFNWPAYNAGKRNLSTGVAAYRCDIAITDYSKIRQRFGVMRAQKLVSQIEVFIRSLVRHPVDMVVGFPGDGSVTLIYESQEGESSSVATRISRRLQRETFRLGRRNVQPKFHYDVSCLV